jgi:hypothetical protein
VDYVDGDPDEGRYDHNLGVGTHFAVDGYMLYRGAGEPYWVYGFANLLANKPKVIPNQQTLVLLGCVGTDPYSPSFTLEEGSQFQLKSGNGSWTRDINGDGKQSGYEALILDMMMCFALGIPHVNIWPGAGPLSNCCDYRQYAETLVPSNQDFFVETAKLLNESWTIQFDFLPGHEHYWDKILNDDLMNFEHAGALIFFPIAAGLISFFSIHQLRILKRREIDLNKNQSHQEKTDSDEPVLNNE